MSEHEQENDLIWRLVHGQLDPQEQADLRGRIAEDPALLEELRKDERVDRLLRYALSEEDEPDKTGEILVDRVLANMGQEGSGDGGGRVLSFPGWARGSSLAIAACVALLLGFWALRPAPLAWTTPTVGVVTLRGDTPIERVYTDAQLLDLADRLESLVSSAYPVFNQQAVPPVEARGRWRLEAKIGEKQQGRLEIAIRGVNSLEPDDERTWYLDADTLENARQDLQAFAEDVAKQLTESVSQ